MFAIYDVRDLSRPFLFEDQDKGTQDYAVFETLSKAVEMAHMMNEVISSTRYVVMQFEKG